MTVYLGEPGYPKPRPVRPACPEDDGDRRLIDLIAALRARAGERFGDHGVLVTYQRDGEVVVAYTTPCEPSNDIEVPT